jgi:hypothetical protein
MLRTGTAVWPLALFGLLTIPAGLALWHRQGANFGLGPHPRAINRADAIGCATLLAAMFAAEVFT